jgi:ribosomal protein S27AE
MANDETYDPEGPGPADEDLMEEDFDWDRDTRTCPECGAALLAEVGKCPACGHWVPAERSTQWPWWVLIPVLLAAVGFLLLQIF